MGMAGEAATTVTGRLMVELKAQREDEGQDELDKRLAIAQEFCVGNLIVEVDGHGAVLSGRFSDLGHVASPCGWPSVWIRHGEADVLKNQADGERIGASPLNPMESAIIKRF
jgi:hypothetical protein